jgi:hypothetical protein
MLSTHGDWPLRESTMKTTPKKLTRREQAYLAHLQRAQARKVALAQYCRARGLNVQSLYNLRHQLSKRSGPRSKASAKQSRPADKFIEVQVAARPVAASRVACRLHRQGWVIECASLPPTGWLAGLLAGDANAVP